MDLKQAIKKYDITDIAQINEEQHIRLARKVAEMISNKFNYIDYDYIYNKMMAAKVYIGHIRNISNKAIYAFDDDSLIIDKNQDLNEMTRELLFECVHTIQDRRNKKGELQQLGQITLTTFKEYAIAINETAVQYIVSKTLENKKISTEVFGIKVNTFHTDKYALICNILEQLKFVIGENQLVKSTIYATDDFIVDGYDAITKTIFDNVQNNMDKMLFAEEEIQTLKRNITEDNKEQNKKLIYENEELIKSLYMDSQMSIFTSHFDTIYKRIQTLLDLTYYKAKLEEYKGLIGVDSNKEKDYMMQYYERYCENKRKELTIKEVQIKAKNNVALTVVSNNIIIKVLTKLREAASRLLNRA